MAWEIGWYYLAAGQSGDYWVTFPADAWVGLQFIAAEPRGPAQTRMDVESYGIQSTPQFGTTSKFAYWVKVVNRGPNNSNFVLRGWRVD